MNPPSRQLKPSLLAFTLWIALNLLSANIQSAQPELAAATQVAPPPSKPSLDAVVMHESANADPAMREWTTKEKSQTLVLRQGTTLIIGPYSRVLRLPMIPVALGGKDFAKSAYSVELETGRIDVDIAPNIRPVFGLVVRAPRKVGAIVKTGKATIAATDGNVTIAARSGNDMMYAVGEQWRPLRVGKAFTVNNRNPQGAQRSLLRSPTLQIDAPVAIALGPTTTRQRLNWTAISGATGYVLRLYREDGATSVLVRESHVNNNSLLLDNLPAGRYSASVSPIDETHLESGQSAKVSFRIVEAILPRGALMAGNTIQLPATERLQLLHVEALEVSYGTSGNDFVAAPQSVGLYDGNPVPVRLREKGGNRETILRLEPLDVQPTLELGPMRARWPGAPVTITIGARHRNGRPAPTDESLVPSVTINNQPTTVKWQKTRGQLSCQVDKPASPGPWVVRVLLRDASGRDVARDFLEVAEHPRQSALTETTR